MQGQTEAGRKPGLRQDQPDSIGPSLARWAFTFAVSGICAVQTFSGSALGAAAASTSGVDRKRSPLDALKEKALPSFAKQGL